VRRLRLYELSQLADSLWVPLGDVFEFQNGQCEPFATFRSGVMSFLGDKPTRLALDYHRYNRMPMYFRWDKWSTKLPFRPPNKSPPMVTIPVVETEPHVVEKMMEAFEVIAVEPAAFVDARILPIGRITFDLLLEAFKTEKAIDALNVAGSAVVEDAGFVSAAKQNQLIQEDFLKDAAASLDYGAKNDETFWIDDFELFRRVWTMGGFYQTDEMACNSGWAIIDTALGFDKAGLSGRDVYQK
jgi:hypothetical protein